MCECQAPKLLSRVVPAKYQIPNETMVKASVSHSILKRWVRISETWTLCNVILQQWSSLLYRFTFCYDYLSPWHYKNNAWDDCTSAEMLLNLNRIWYHRYMKNCKLVLKMYLRPPIIWSFQTGGKKTVSVELLAWPCKPLVSWDKVSTNPLMSLWNWNRGVGSLAQLRIETRFLGYSHKS